MLKVSGMLVCQTQGPEKSDLGCRFSGPRILKIATKASQAPRKGIWDADNRLLGGRFRCPGCEKKGSKANGHLGCQKSVPRTANVESVWDADFSDPGS
jgi:hypothetical protein